MHRASSSVWFAEPWPWQTLAQMSDILSRMKGEAPNGEPGAARPSPGRAQLEPREPSGKTGLNPFVVAGVAFAVGTVLAKLIDWRGHAHPKR
jgi:hypothetical protein